jgi:hypothetical protein
MSSETLKERGEVIASLLRALGIPEEEVQKFVEEFIQDREKELGVPREKIRFDGLSRYYVEE